MEPFPFLMPSHEPSGRPFLSAASGQIYWRDPLREATHLIGYHELRVWFEPDWGVGRVLAQRFPHCLIYSIPFESNTASLYRVPAWRPRPRLTAFV